MDRSKQIIIIEKLVEDYISKNKNMIPFHIFTNEQSLRHVKEIGVSILCTKWKIGYEGGSFVRNFVNNKLSESFNTADYIIRDSMYFLNMLNINVPLPSELI
jgi:hypothetical protein